MTAVASPPLANAAQVALNSRAVVVLTGLAYFFAALSSAYLDRAYQSFASDSLRWGIWALLGFGAAAWHTGKPPPAGRKQWILLGSLSLLFVLLPAFAYYNMLRWTSLALLVVIGARAAVMRTRQDFYLTLTVAFVISFMAGSHGRADWTLWFYLGPAWVFGGLALAWEHAHGAGLSRAVKATMTLGFISAALTLALLLFFLAPRPPVLGFGFLPQEAGADGTNQNAPGGSGEQGGRNPARADDPGGSGAGRRGDSGQSGNAAPPGWAQRWGNMLADMRRASHDVDIPQWQRQVMGQLLRGAQAGLDGLAYLSTGPGDPAAGDQPLVGQGRSVTLTVNGLLLLVLLACAWLLWRRRYRIGMATVLAFSWSLARPAPGHSMRLSAQAIHWCLRLRGLPRQPGQSVREYWSGAPGIDPLARRWIDQAMEGYCAMRFGRQAAATQGALHMHNAVQGACDILLNKAPELRA